MKDSHYIRWVKHLFHVQGSLAPNQSQEANQVGANAFTYLYFYILISSLIFTGLSSWISRTQLFQFVIISNVLVTFIIGGLYFKESLTLLGLKAQSEAPITQAAQIRFACQQAFQNAALFWILMVFNDQLSGTSFVKSVENLKTFLVTVVLAIFIGISTLITESRRRHKP